MTRCRHDDAEKDPEANVASSVPRIGYYEDVMKNRLIPYVSVLHDKSSRSEDNNRAAINSSKLIPRDSRASVPAPGRLML